MTFRYTLPLLLVLCLTFPACGRFSGDPPGQPEVEDYDRSCSMDSDCSIAWLDRACACSERVAVNASETDDIEADNDEETRYEGRCMSRVACGAPLPAEAYCNMGTCDLRDVME